MAIPEDMVLTLPVMRMQAVRGKKVRDPSGSPRSSSLLTLNDDIDSTTVMDDELWSIYGGPCRNCRSSLTPG